MRVKLFNDEIDGELVCLGFQKRVWDLVRATDTRFYVHETLSFEEDSTKMVSLLWPIAYRAQTSMS